MINARERLAATVQHTIYGREIIILNPRGLLDECFKRAKYRRAVYDIGRCTRDVHFSRYRNVGQYTHKRELCLPLYLPKKEGEARRNKEGR